MKSIVSSVAVFYSDDQGTVFRALLLLKKCTWMIDYHNPKSPIPIFEEGLASMKRVPVPEDFEVEAKRTELIISAKDRRLEIIKPLIENMTYIFDRMDRSQLVRILAKEYNPSDRTINRWYFNYLAGGEMRLFPKEIEHKEKPLTIEERDYRWAINKFYFSPRKSSLSGAYELMLLYKYTNSNGRLFDKHPSLGQFRYFYYKKYYNPVKKVIARKGINEYRRNYRPLYGTASDRVKTIGSYEIDSTIADIYLVSRNDRKKIIGRPNIYFTVDIASRLITGLYVGLKSGRDAVSACLRQAAMDKVEYCAKYNIDITSADWPSKDLPSELVTDRANEY